MKRIALGISYNGHAFAGWQRQPEQRTAQGLLEQALSQVADHAVTVNAAGRTDRGVHALNQVVHFETNANRDERAWILGCNTALPPDITVCWSREMPLDFHARHSAVARTYEYWIYNNWIRPKVMHQYIGWYYQSLDVNLMQRAANTLLGKHDFSAFRASQCQASTAVREVHAIRVQRLGLLVQLEITANAFLYHMVRNIVGVLVQVGSARKTPDWTKKVLESCDRSQAADMAPASGLYLSDVSYGPRYEIPASSRHEMQKLLQSIHS